MNVSQYGVIPDLQESTEIWLFYAKPFVYLTPSLNLLKYT